MKNYLLLIGLICYCSTLKAQYIPTQKAPDTKKTHKEYQQKIEDLKSRTTIFVMPNYIEPQHYHDILKEYWTFNKFKVIPAEAYNCEQYISDEYAVFDLVLETVTRVDQTTRAQQVVGVYPELMLRTFDPRLKGVLKKIRSKNYKTSKKNERINDAYNSYHAPWVKIFMSIEGDVNYFDRDLISTLYKKDIMVNFSLGHFKNYIQKLNKDLENYQLFTRSRIPEISIVSKEMVQLIDHTLYVHDYLGANKKGISGEEHIKDLFEDYRYDYEIVSKKELEAAILDNKPMYYITFTNYLSKEKCITITNGQTGKVVFRHLVPGMVTSSNYLKKKHIKDIINELPKKQ
ncbi:hypothetical protein [Flammeovirga sp. OC4]|uniref:hypothetical protein n=1 Tax=Flammeovirga sp. OC4 TaxID=1382345 RepID=UPI0005C5FE43|nr:hypothetical protein [Flammeovirga sp. OC4]